MDTNNPSLPRPPPYVPDRGSPAAEIRPHARISLLGRFLLALLQWQDRARQRQHLATLDPRMLRDMGMTPNDVARELGKMHWRR